MRIECEAKIGYVAWLGCTFAASASGRRRSSLFESKEDCAVDRARVRAAKQCLPPAIPGFTSGPRAISLVVFRKFHKKTRRRILASRETNRKHFCCVSRHAPEVILRESQKYMYSVIAIRVCLKWYFQVVHVRKIDTFSVSVLPNTFRVFSKEEKKKRITGMKLR